MGTEKTASSEQDFSVTNLNLPDRTSMGAYIVFVEPKTKFYRFCVAIGQAFSLASLIAWFVLLVALIVLAFTLVNNLEAVDVMREQQAAFNLHYGKE